MIGKLLTLLVLSAISSLLYRMGGSKHWNTRWRDIGCSIVTLLTCIVLGLLGNNVISNVIAYFLTFGFSWGALSAYWGQDEKKHGFFWHGLGLALAVLPIAWLTQHWIGFGIRCLVLPTAIALWSDYNGNDIVEECGRGALITLTLPILLL